IRAWVPASLAGVRPRDRGPETTSSPVPARPQSREPPPVPVASVSEVADTSSTPDRGRRSPIHHPHLFDARRNPFLPFPHSSHGAACLPRIRGGGKRRPYLACPPSDCSRHGREHRGRRHLQYER